MGLESEVAQLRRGDLDALSALLTRYQNRLYRYLLRLVRNPAEAEDLFQQTWIRVAEKIRQYDSRRNFEAWLFTVARNIAIDHLRRMRPESLDEPIEGAPGESAATRLRSSDPPVLDGIVERERTSRLAHALDLLPVTHREVLCPHCGTPLQATCPSCGHAVERGWANCPHCGTKLPPQRGRAA